MGLFFYVIVRELCLFYRISGIPSVLMVNLFNFTVSCPFVFSVV
jgi:hypothetical protein